MRAIPFPIISLALTTTRFDDACLLSCLFSVGADVHVLPLGHFKRSERPARVLGRLEGGQGHYESPSSNAHLSALTSVFRDLAFQQPSISFGGISTAKGTSPGAIV